MSIAVETIVRDLGDPPNINEVTAMLVDMGRRGDEDDFLTDSATIAGNLKMRWAQIGRDGGVSIAWSFSFAAAEYREQNRQALIDAVGNVLYPPDVMRRLAIKALVEAESRGLSRGDEKRAK